MHPMAISVFLSGFLESVRSFTVGTWNGLFGDHRIGGKGNDFI